MFACWARSLTTSTAPERDRAGNRQLFSDQYASVLVLSFFTPVVPSLRGLHQPTTLATVQARLGVHPTSLRALREAADVFDAALAQGIAVDGSLVPALPRLAWALGQDDQHRAAKMPVAFAVLRQGPIDVTGTAGHGSERAEWRRLVPPGGFSVVARGSVDSSVFQERHALPCSFLCRVKATAAYEVEAERALAPAAGHAGVVRDAVRRRVGTAHHTHLLPPPCRMVQVATGKTRQEGTPEILVVVTNRLDVDAELLVMAYRYRWAVELLFRGVTCVLGGRHVLSQGSNGTRLQVYAACIASLVISLGVGQTPTKRTEEMRCFSLSGWPTEAEVITHIDCLHLKAPPPCKNWAGHYWR